MIFVWHLCGTSLEAVWALLNLVLLAPRVLACSFLLLVLVMNVSADLVVVETLLREAAAEVVIIQTTLRILLRHGTLLGCFGARPSAWIAIRFVEVHVPGGHVFGILVAQQLVLRGDALGAPYALLVLLLRLFQIVFDVCVQVLLFKEAHDLF